MKLIEKLKEIPKIMLLSAALSIPFSGCATPWQAVKTEFQPTGVEKKVILGTSAPKKKEMVEFNISDPYKEHGAHKVKIKESLKEINSQTKTIGIEKYFAEFEIEEREKVDAKFVAGMSGMMALTFGAIGGAAGYGLSYLDYEDPDFQIVCSILGGLVGAGGGAVFGVIAGLIHPDGKYKETRKIGTDEFTKELSDARKTEEEVLDECLIYDNNAAKNINVEFSGKGLVSKIYKTDYSGALDFSHIAESFNSRYFFGTYSKDWILERIGNISLVRQIRPNIRDSLKNELYEEISPKKITFTLKTAEPSTLTRIVKNTSRTFNWEGHQLTDDAIYQVVREFVDEEINSRIKSLEFTVKDAISHIPINSSNFELETDAPSKADLAGRYFTQELKDYAKKYITDYLIGNTTIWDSPETISFDVYGPSRIFLEVTHPDYNFVSGQVLVGNKDSKKTVYMVDKGSKIRVQDADNERGRIE